MVKTVYNNFRSHPNYSEFSIAIDEHDIVGSASISSSKNGQVVNKFYFHPNASGNIASIAIYGSYLNSHYNAINSSKLVFGLKVSELEMVTTNTQSPFVDIYLQPY